MTTTKIAESDVGHLMKLIQKLWPHHYKRRNGEEVASYRRTFERLPRSAPEVAAWLRDRHVTSANLPAPAEIYEALHVAPGAAKAARQESVADIDRAFLVANYGECLANIDDVEVAALMTAHRRRVSADAGEFLKRWRADGVQAAIDWQRHRRAATVAELRADGDAKGGA